MGYKGSKHRIGIFKDYQTNLEQIKENMKNVTGTPCPKHECFNKYCVECWRVTESREELNNTDK